MNASRYKLSESIPSPAEACNLLYSSFVGMFGFSEKRPSTGKEAVCSVAYPTVGAGAIACLNIFYPEWKGTIATSVTVGIFTAVPAASAFKNCREAFFTSEEQLEKMYQGHAAGLEEPLATQPSSDSPHHTV
jgi:hypothetical protein